MQEMSGCIDFILKLLHTNWMKKCKCPNPEEAGHVSIPIDPGGSEVSRKQFTCTVVSMELKCDYYLFFSIGITAGDMSI